MIEFYLGEEPILEQVPTYVCLRDDDRTLRARAPRRAGGQGGRRGRRLRHADGPAVDRRASATSSAAASSPSRAATSRSTGSSCRPARRGSRERGAVEPRRVDLRPYILTSREGPWVLPGGLTRVALVARQLRRQLVAGRRQQGHLGDEGARVISRVADHCFWFGRYVERAEATARMLAATACRSRSTPSCRRRRCGGRSSSCPARRPRSATRIAGGDDDHPAWGDGEVVQRFMVWDEDNGVSLARSVSGARWNARSIREVLSLEAWEAVNELHLWMRSDVAHGDLRAAARRRSTSTCGASTQLTLGLLRSTMLHDEPLDFIWLGVLLERVSQTARMLDVHHHAFTNLPRRARGRRDRAVAVAAARAVGLRGVPEARGRPGQLRGRRAVPDLARRRSRARSRTACTRPTTGCATSARPSTTAARRRVARAAARARRLGRRAPAGAARPARRSTSS